MENLIILGVIILGSAVGYFLASKYKEKNK